MASPDPYSEQIEQLKQLVAREKAAATSNRPTYGSPNAGPISGAMTATEIMMQQQVAGMHGAGMAVQRSAKAELEDAITGLDRRANITRAAREVLEHLLAQVNLGAFSADKHARRLFEDAIYAGIQAVQKHL